MGEPASVVSSRWSGERSSRLEVEAQEVSAPQLRAPPEDVVPGGFELGKNLHAAEPGQAQLTAQPGRDLLGQRLAALEEFPSPAGFEGHQALPAVVGPAGAEVVERVVEALEILQRDINPVAREIHRGV